MVGSWLSWLRRASMGKGGRKCELVWLCCSRAKMSSTKGHANVGHTSNYGRISDSCSIICAILPTTCWHACIVEWLSLHSFNALLVHPLPHTVAHAVLRNASVGVGGHPVGIRRGQVAGQTRGGRRGGDNNWIWNKCTVQYVPRRMGKALYEFWTCVHFHTSSVTWGQCWFRKFQGPTSKVWRSRTRCLCPSRTGSYLIKLDH